MHPFNISKLGISKVLFVVALMQLCSCTYQYTTDVATDTLEKAYLKSKFTIDRNSDWLVHVNTPVALAGAQHIQGRSMPRNIASLNAALDLSFRKLFPNFSSVELRVDSDLGSMFEQAQNQKRELLFVPSVISVEDRLNTQRELMEGQELHPEKDYGLDQVVFQMLIYEVRTKKVIDTAIVTSRSRYFAGNASIPQDLYRQASSEYLSVVTGKPI